MHLQNNYFINKKLNTTFKFINSTCFTSSYNVLFHLQYTIPEKKNIYFATINQLIYIFYKTLTKEFKVNKS